MSKVEASVVVTPSAPEQNPGGGALGHVSSVMVVEGSPLRMDPFRLESGQPVPGVKTAQNNRPDPGR